MRSPNMMIITFGQIKILRNREVNWVPHSLHTELSLELVDGIHSKIQPDYRGFFAPLTALSSKENRKRSQTRENQRWFLYVWRMSTSSSCSGIKWTPPWPGHAPQWNSSKAWAWCQASVGPTSIHLQFRDLSESGASHWSCSPGTRNEASELSSCLCWEWGSCSLPHIYQGQTCWAMPITDPVSTETWQVVCMKKGTRVVSTHLHS